MLIIKRVRKQDPSAKFKLTAEVVVKFISDDLLALDANHCPDVGYGLNGYLG